MINVITTMDKFKRKRESKSLLIFRYSSRPPYTSPSYSSTTTSASSYTPRVTPRYEYRSKTPGLVRLCRMLDENDVFSSFANSKIRVTRFFIWKLISSITFQCQYLGYNSFYRYLSSGSHLIILRQHLQREEIEIIVRYLDLREQRPHERHLRGNGYAFLHSDFFENYLRIWF